jgi:hypothetical protein
MTYDSDPVLQALFDAAPRATADDAFVSHVMRQIDRQRQRTVFAWIIAGVAMLPIGWWLSGPIVKSIELAARLMPDSLISIETVWLEHMLAPVNSVTGVVGLVFLFVWWLVRKVRA